MEFVHKPVLFQETIAALNIRPEGIYFDGTAGGGGHSSAIAEKLTSGRLVSVDQDPDALKAAGERLSAYANVTVVAANFSDIDQVLDKLDIPAVDGVLLDIGVSSHQLDTPERGFSYHHDAPLDMRMRQEGITAADLVNNVSEGELTKILSLYGEEKYARSIARNIVKQRVHVPIQTTFQLNEIIKSSMPEKAKRDGHPARKTFQALRIAVNGELEHLETAIDKSFDKLNPGGRLVIITFHSLEDRIVKQKFNKLCEGCTCPPDFPVCVCGKKPRARLPFKVVKPTKEEEEENPRCRSAKLRCLEKIF